MNKGEEKIEQKPELHLVCATPTDLRIIADALDTQDAKDGMVFEYSDEIGFMLPPLNLSYKGQQVLQEFVKNKNPQWR